MSRWTEQEANGVRGLDGASEARVMLPGPDGRLRPGVVERRVVIMSGRSWTPPDPAASPRSTLSVGQLLVHRIEAGSVREMAAGGHVNGRLKTTGVMWGYVPLTRHFSPTTRSADCP